MLQRMKTNIEKLKKQSIGVSQLLYAEMKSHPNQGAAVIHLLNNYNAYESFCEQYSPETDA